MGPGTREHLERALFQLESAIQLLDEAEAPPEIATHVDLARSMLQTLLSGLANRAQDDS